MHSLEAYFGRSKDTKKRKADEISANPPEAANSPHKDIQHETKKVKSEGITSSDLLKPLDKDKRTPATLKSPDTRSPRKDEYVKQEEPHYLRNPQPEKREGSRSPQQKTETVKKEEDTGTQKVDKVKKEEQKIAHDMGLVKKEEIISIIKKEHVSQSNVNRPILWINKLRYYPEDDLLPNMVSFREMLFEDLLKDKSKKPKRTLQSAFVTTFGYNLELIEPLLKTGVKVVLANEWENPSEPRIEKNVEGYPNFTIIRPPKDPMMNFRGAFHPKLWVFKFPNILRVVVATGNLTAGDWIIWSNGLWFRDFPLKSQVGSTSQKIEASEDFDFDEDFRVTLKAFLQSLMPVKMPYHEFLDFNLDDYRISDIDIVLIPSLPGRFKDNDFDKYGHRRIGAVLKKLMPAFEQDKPKKRVVTYQTSSMGSINEKYIKEFLGSLIPNYISLDQLKAESKYKGGITPSGDTLLKRLRVIYPTKDYVENCIEGSEYSGCLLLSEDNYQNPKFPKFIFHQFQGPDHYFYHEGLIAHIKVFIVTDESGEIEDDTYIYFGSANLSPSAWGRYEKDYTQFTISHTELGVLIPPKKGKKHKLVKLIDIGSKERKRELVKNLPFKFPPEKYKKDQVPWIFNLHFDPKK